MMVFWGRAPSEANGNSAVTSKGAFQIPDEHPVVAISVDRGGATAVVRIRGELDYSSSDQLGSAIEGTQQANAQPVVVDFSECRYIDSTVLTVLIRASKALGDTLRIVVPLDSHIRRIFAITNLDRMLNIDEKLEGALEERP
jgi:anti-sigma B factor antagonist